MTPACELRSLTVQNGQSFTLGPISLTINPGQCLGILGENGSGKSTLLKAIADKPITKNQILLNYQDSQSLTPKARSKLVATVPQTIENHLDFTVLETVALGRTPYIDGLWESPDDHKIINQAIQTANLYHLQDRPLSQISGGERQRTLIARALAQEAPLLLLDEPTSHLDIKHHQTILNLINLLKSQNQALILASHDINWLLECADNILTLKNGQPISLDQTKNLTEDTLSQVFDVPFARHQIGNKTRFLPI